MQGHAGNVGAREGVKMTDFEKRVADLERAVRHLVRERWDLAHPPGHAERDARMPAILRTKPQPETESNHAENDTNQNPV